jgi:hypothetical protein
MHQFLTVKTLGEICNFGETAIIHDRTVSIPEKLKTCFKNGETVKVILNGFPANPKSTITYISR